MTYKVAALYQFVSLPDFRELKAPLERLCADLALKGTILLADEGINGTVAGLPDAIDTFVTQCATGALFRQRLGNLELKFSTALEMPFRRMKVRLKKEIVTLGHAGTDPTRQVGTYVAAEDWNTLLATPDLILIDTRNQFEIEMGTFIGATDPRIARFSEFRDFVARELDPARHKKIAMFCTGGIRCEKASSFMLSHGFEQVFHLKGGILRYLETVPKAESRWDGECFVFDERIALDHGLVERAIAQEENTSE